MRLTKQQITGLDRENLVNILNSIRDVLKKLENTNAAIDEIDKKIETVNLESERIKKGPSTETLSNLAILCFLIGFVLSPVVGFILISVVVAYYFVNRYILAANREKKATQYYNTNASVWLQTKNTLNKELNNLRNSDEMYNALMILPKRYMTSEKTEILSDIINQGRAQNISEAIFVYENIWHSNKEKDGSGYDEQFCNEGKMYCPYCGKEIEADAQYCQYCGEKISYCCSAKAH